MTPAVAIARRANRDRTKVRLHAKPEPRRVTRFELLAANMPSVLDRVGTMNAVPIARLHHFSMATARLSDWVIE